MSAFVVSNISQSLKIDNNQRFIFGLLGSPEPLGAFKLDNIYIPVLGSPSLTNFEIRNQSLSGYRWIHETRQGDTYGRLRLQKFLTASNTGTDILSFGDDGSINIPGTSDASYILQTPSAALSNSQSLSTLQTGILKNTTGTGVLSIATPGVDYLPMNGGTLTGDLILNGDPTNPLGAVTRQYVDSATSATFGPNISLPYSQLNFNWSYISPTNPTPYEFVNTFSDNQISKNFKYRVLTNDILAREWIQDYTLIGNSDINGIYSLTYNTFSTSATPLSVAIYPFAPSQNLMSISVPINMNGFEIRNALDPTSAQSLATKNYVDTRSFSNNQTVNGSTQTFNYLNTLSSSVFAIQNTNASAVTRFKAGTNFDFVELGYDGNNGYSYINLAQFSNDRLAFRVNGTGIAAFLSTGLFGFGTITPTQAKVVINGGVQNIAGEDSCLRIISSNSSTKLELQNTGATGKIYELRSNSNGSLDIVNRTGSFVCLSVNGTTGSITNINSLYFLNDSTQKKLVFYDTTNNNHQYYGIGIDSGTLRYQSNSSHLFWIGTSSTTSYCGLSINSSGNVGLGNYQNSTLSRLFINGGPTLDAVGEESVIRVQNSDLLSTSVKIQIVHQNAKNWELKSNSNGSFEIYDKFGSISRFLINGSGSSTLNGSLNVTSTLSTNSNFNADGNGYVLGSFGVGTSSVTSAKMQIVGGVQNFVGEESALRLSGSLSSIKLELQNTGASGKIYEIRSSSTGQFDITNRTDSITRFCITSSGNFGINMGLSSPNAQLQLVSAIRNRQFVLYEAANNDYQFHGFGSVLGGLGYNINATTDSHIFYAGVNSSSRNEIARIKGNGDLLVQGTIYGRSASGMIYMQNNITTTSLTANIWAKLLGTTTISSDSNQFSSSVSGRITYTGSDPIVCRVDVATTLSFSAGGGGTTRSISIFKNGAQVVPSLMSENVASNTDLNMYTNSFVSLSTNDYLEIYCRSSSNTNVTPNNLTLIVTAN